jgi:hypothetical protein
MILRRKFNLTGGRAGVITFREGAATGELEWEMLVREIDMVIYGERCAWTSPERRPMARADVTRLTQELANEMRIKIDVAFSDSSEIVSPTRAG